MENSRMFMSVEDQLAQLRAAFVAGNQSALLDASLLALQNKVLAPDWLADAARDVEAGLKSERFRDANHAFGWTNKGRKKRLTRHRRETRKSAILAALVRYRLDGGSMTTEIYTKAINDELHVGVRAIKAVYEDEKNRQLILSLPTERENKADTFSFAEIEFQEATVSGTA